MSGRGLSVFRGSQWTVRNAAQCRTMQLRTFTSSVARQRSSVVPAFKPTSSPELDTLLQEVREKVILPSYLSKMQRDLIFKDKYKKTLEVEPVFAKIGDEEFRLQHIDLMNDVPSSQKSLRKAMSLMKERSDWENMTGLLAGIRRKSSNPQQLNRVIIRALGQAGRQDVLLECLRQASQTGVRLRYFSTTFDALTALSAKAVESKWDAAETKKALRWSEQVLDLLEDPKHSPSEASPLFDSRRRPEVIGQVLQLAAVKASKHQDGKDLDGKVEQLSRRVLDCYSNTKEELSKGNVGSPNRIAYLHNSMLRFKVPLLHGMKIAEEVLGSDSDITVQLKEKATELEEEVNSAYKSLIDSEWAKKTARGGVIAYETLLSPKS
ncbi:hypothetical protein LOCC1_G005414 [Lachnellula occidentalis]|uniref:Uncharacterized protein n=1 Tax=Lachnellula occidentalis TaxID=215460 RepID=A0A8H8UD11_9HELO|nr:hypothetical protein LOCC1_G005414 [Lachnellula occidentalis]